MALDLELAPADLPRLIRAPALLAARRGRARNAPASIVWHDTVDGDLAAESLSLSQGACPGARGLWRLELLYPDGRMDWPPAATAPVLAEAESVDALGRPMPGKLSPVAAFQGRLRSFPLDGVQGTAGLSVLDGMLRGVAQDRPACRVTLQGEARSVAALAMELSQAVRLSVPRAGLAAQAIAFATGRAPAPRHIGAPAIPPGVTVAEALGLATAHLAHVILHWAALVPEGRTPEPVHQMRVGVRRLRSALAVFRRAAQAEPPQSPWLDELAAELKALAAKLGAARDWDVFLAETGAEIGRAFAHDRRIGQLLAAAERRRRAAYAELAAALDSLEWTRLQMSLALLPTTRPWHADATVQLVGELTAPVKDFAPAALSRRLKRVLARGATLTGLTAHELHEIRKRAKRLRYAIEVFAPLFPAKQVRKYLRRLERLQEVLGSVNDAATAAALVAQLGGGADRAFAAGVVQGFGAGRAADTVKTVERAWGKFARAAPFWD